MSSKTDFLKFYILIFKMLLYVNYSLHNMFFCFQVQKPQDLIVTLKLKKNV